MCLRCLAVRGAVDEDGRRKEVCSSCDKVWCAPPLTAPILPFCLLPLLSSLKSGPSLLILCIITILHASPFVFCCFVFFVKLR